MASGYQRADKEYNAGDVINDYCYPITKALKVKYMQSHCYNCFQKKQDLIHCGPCGLIKYCNKNCKTEDWNNGHKFECTSVYFRRMCQDNENNRSKLLAFRLYAQLQINKNISLKKFDLFDGTSLCLADWIYANEQQLMKEDVLNVAQDMVNMSRLLDNSLLENSNIRLLVNFVQNNWIRLACSTNCNKIGWGCYIALCNMKNSCKPTARCENHGLRLQLRAIANVEEGQAPSISIVKKVMNNSDRRKKLIKYRCLICSCPTCNPGKEGAVDFVKVLTLYDELMILNRFENLNLVWQDVYKKYLTLYNLLRKIYKEYDEHITNLFIAIAITAILLDVNTKTSRTLFDNAIKHMDITFGEESAAFKVLCAAGSSHFRYSYND